MRGQVAKGWTDSLRRGGSYGAGGAAGPVSSSLWSDLATVNGSSPGGVGVSDRAGSEARLSPTSSAASLRSAGLGPGSARAETPGRRAWH